MNIKFDPQGTKAPKPEERQPVWMAYNGDTITFESRCYIKGSVPVDYENSNLYFILSDKRFSVTPLWIGEWRDGIELVDVADHPGLICVKIPDSISTTLRRGSYIFSLLVEDRDLKIKETKMEGMLQIEYAPTSAIHDIPYRDQ